MVNFDKDAGLHRSVIRYLRAHVAKVEPAAVKKSSGAAEGMNMWVVSMLSYSEVVATVDDSKAKICALRQEMEFLQAMIDRSKRCLDDDDDAANHEK